MFIQRNNFGFDDSARLNSNYGKTGLISEMNLVPYIDVMLVLLIIFMVTAPLLNQGVSIQLPQLEHSQALPEGGHHQPLIITVNQAGEFFLNDNLEPSVPLSHEQLQIKVLAHLQVTPGRFVLVRGDVRAAYRDVLQAMSCLQAAGVSQIGLETERLEK